MTNDDLTQIKHIGRVTAERMREDGLTTFDQIAQISKEQWLTYQGATESEYEEMIASAKEIAESGASRSDKGVDVSPQVGSQNVINELSNKLGVLEDEIEQLLDLGVPAEVIATMSGSELDSALTYAKGSVGEFRPQARAMYREMTLRGDNGEIAVDGKSHAQEQAQKLPVGIAGVTKRVGIPGMAAGNAGTLLPVPESAAGLHPDNSGWTALGPFEVGGRTRTILIDKDDPNLMWAGGVDGGIWRSDDGGNIWNPTQDLMGNLAVCALAQGPDPAGSGYPILYAGTGEWVMASDGAPGNGIFMSYDGWSWEQIEVTKPTPCNQKFRNVMGLAVSQDGTRILAATSRGLFGITWDNANDKWKIASGGYAGRPMPVNNAWGTRIYNFYDYFVQVIIDPANDLKAVAGGRYGKVKYTIDGGNLWHDAVWKTRSGAGVSTFDFQRVAICYAKADSNIVYASVYRNRGNSRAQLFASNDGGKTFILKNGTINNELLEANRAYFGLDALGDQVFDERAVKGGWTGNQGDYDNVIWAGDPENSDLVVVAGLNIYRSLDGGNSFAPISTWQSQSSVHADHHVIVEHPYFGRGNKQVFFGNDGGLYKTDDIYKAGFDSSAFDLSRPSSSSNPYPQPPFNDNWRNLNSFFAVTQFYFGAGNLAKRAVIGGAQDNGTWGRSLGNIKWDNPRIAGGDGTCVAADPTVYKAGTPDEYTYWYGAFPGLKLFRAKRTEIRIGGSVQARWEIFRDIAKDITDGNKPFIGNFVLDPKNPKIMYAGATSLWKSTNIQDARPRWKNTGSSSSKISSITIGFATRSSRSNTQANLALIGHVNGVIKVSKNIDSNRPIWSEVSTATTGVSASRAVLSLCIDPTPNSNDDVHTWYAGFAGLQQPNEPGNIWKTTDGGTTWDDISQGIIKSPVHAITTHPQNSDWVYLGTEFGVFASVDGGKNWAVNNEGPANTAVYDLFWLGNTLVAVTHGRGMFQIDLTIPSLNGVLASDTRGSIHHIDSSGTLVKSVILRDQSPLSGILVPQDVQSLKVVIGSQDQPDPITGITALDRLEMLAFVGDDTGTLYGVDSYDLSVVWQATLSGGLAVAPRLWFDPDRRKVYLIAATTDGQVMGFDVIDNLANSSPTTPAVTPNISVSLGSTEVLDIKSFEVMDGWGYLCTDKGLYGINLQETTPIKVWERTDLKPVAPVLFAANTLYVPTVEALYAIESRTGENVQTSTSGRSIQWPVMSNTPICTKPVWTLGAVVFGTESGEVNGVDYRNGSELFVIPSSGSSVKSLTTHDNRIYYATNTLGDSQLWCYDISPELNGPWAVNKDWEIALPTHGSVVRPHVQGYIPTESQEARAAIFLATEDAKIYAFRDDGNPLWTTVPSIVYPTSHSPVVVQAPMPRI